MVRYRFFRAAAALAVFAACALLGPPRVGAAQYAVLTIYNDTHVAITQLYNRNPGQTFWGINDLAGSGAVQPGHSFYIRMVQNAYGHCPSFYQDVKLVFANGAVKVLPHVSVCNIDAHIHQP
jgi:hypothetical protein